MLIRVISDLHIDVNRLYPFSFTKDEKNYFTLIAGDVSGSVKTTTEWIKDNVSSGCFIAGNHDPSYNDIQWTINRQKRYLADNFNTPDSKIKFMDIETDSMTYEIPGTNIIVIGSTLYTDYKHSNSYVDKQLEIRNSDNVKYHKKPIDIQELNMMYALRGLNDFKWGHVEDETDESGIKQRIVRPKDYLSWFTKTFAQISYLVEKNADKDVIILTHHCPSFFCVASEYTNTNMNASYISDLEEFIHSHPNIRAWVCGHVHNTNIIKINERTTIVQNPRGYEKSGESKYWSPNIFIDTDTWNVLNLPYKNEKLDQIRRELGTNIYSLF